MILMKIPRLSKTVNLKRSVVVQLLLPAVWATELVKGKTIYEALEITNKAVMEALDGLPPVKVHCSLLAEEAIHAALWDYAKKHNITIEGLEEPKSDISEGLEEDEY